MPTNIKIVHTQDFIRVQPDGTLDLPASRSLLRGLVTEFGTAGEYYVLIDTRRADAQLSAAQIFEIAHSVAAEPAFARRKVCLLVPKKDDLDAAFFETVSRNRGADVRAFTDFEPAISWLVMQGQS